MFPVTTESSDETALLYGPLNNRRFPWPILPLSLEIYIYIYIYLGCYATQTKGERDYIGNKGED